jgi:hypothetical protein
MLGNANGSKTVKKEREMARCTYLIELSETTIAQASCPLTDTPRQAWVNSWPCLGKNRLAVSTPAVQGLTPPVRLLTQTAARTSASQTPDNFLLIHSNGAGLLVGQIIIFGKVPAGGSKLME